MNKEKILKYTNGKYFQIKIKIPIAIAHDSILYAHIAHDFLHYDNFRFFLYFFEYRRYNVIMLFIASTTTHRVHGYISFSFSPQMSFCFSSLFLSVIALTPTIWISISILRHLLFYFWFFWFFFFVLTLRILVTHNSRHARMFKRWTGRHFSYYYYIIIMFIYYWTPTTGIMNILCRFTILE